jgi:hypothetical protein
MKKGTRPTTGSRIYLASGIVLAFLMVFSLLPHEVWAQTYRVTLPARPAGGPLGDPTVGPTSSTPEVTIESPLSSSPGPISPSGGIPAVTTNSTVNPVTTNSTGPSVVDGTLMRATMYAQLNKVTLQEA